MWQERDRHDPQSEPTLRIITLGTFLILYKEHGEWEPVRDAVLAARGPSLALLKVLVSSLPSMDSHQRTTRRAGQAWERHEASRDSVIDALWPDENAVPADPENAVSVAKSVLNRALRRYTKEDVILLTDGTDRVGYRLNTQVVEIDVDAFEWAVHLASEAEGRGEREAAHALWEKAYTIAQGEYLPYDTYNDWSSGRRKRVQGKYQLTLHRLSWHYVQQGRTVEATELLHPHVLAYPTDLDALCVLLPLLARQGRYEEALHLFQRGKQSYLDEGVVLPPSIALLEKQIRQVQGEALGTLVQTAFSLDAQERLDLVFSKMPPQGSSQESSTKTETSSPCTISEKHVATPPVPVFFSQEFRLLNALGEAQEGAQSPPGFVASASGLLLPFSLATQIEGAADPMLDAATWFGGKISDISALIASWSEGATACHRLQFLVQSELERLNDMSQHTSSKEDHLISRRTALASLALLSGTLIRKVQAGPLTATLLEEFLPQCTKSIVACQQLLEIDGIGIATVEQALPKYLSVLEMLAQTSSSYQQASASLAAQGCLLAALVALHRNHLSKSETYYHQAVEYSHVAALPNLEVAALKQLATRLLEDCRTKEALTFYQQACEVITNKQNVGEETISPRLTGMIYLGMAAASTQLTKKLDRDAESYLDQAHQLWSLPLPHSVPYANPGIHNLYTWEGLSYVELGHYETASAIFAKAEMLTTEVMPERARLEIVNHQAATAIAAGNLDEFERYLLVGAQGAQALGSQKRWQEVVANWKLARQAWPHETKILQLADALI